MTSKPRTIGEFTVLPVAYSGTATHFLYVRKNASSEGKTSTSLLPDDRTLFIVNLPPDATEGELKQFFSTCGQVQRVVFGKQSLEILESEDDEDKNQEEEEKGNRMDEDDASEDSQSDSDSPKAKKKKGGKKDAEPAAPVPKVIPLPTVPLRTLRPTGHTAHIIFHSPSSLTSARSLPSSSSSTPLPWPKSKLPSGLSHYLTQHRSLRPTLPSIRQHVDSSLLVYEHSLAAQKALKGHTESKYKKGEAIVDDDGFTLVTRGGVYGQTVGGGVGVASKKFMKEQKEALRSGKRGKKKKEKRKEGFYDFQNREKKLQAQIQMKKKWEEDLAKVAKLRASRNFKPY